MRAQQEQMGEASMATSSLTKLEVEGVVFPPAVTPPGSSKALFLGGAGVRGLEIEGQFIAFTTIGVYLEDAAVQSLAGKWKGKTADELTDAVDFFRDIFTGPFEKFTRVTMLKPLTGQQYSEKVSENCLAQWKAAGIYTEAEGAAVEQFKEAFKAVTFPPGSSILFTHAPSGPLTIAFSKDGSMPETGSVGIQNQALSEAILESIIGEHGVSPAAKRSLALRFSGLLKEPYEAEESKMANPVAVNVL